MKINVECKDHKEKLKRQTRGKLKGKLKDKDISKLSQKEKDDLLIALAKIHDLI